MAILVLVEHDNKNIKKATLSTLAAARQLEASDIHLFVAGNKCQSVAEEAAILTGVTQVLLCEHIILDHLLAESLTQVLFPIAKSYSHILAPATTFGKNVLPRLAAMIDVAQVSDVIEIITPNTFVRPIYAGNALATVESLDPIKLLTIRTTAFDGERGKQSPAPIENVNGEAANQSFSQFVEAEESKSSRPDLTAARVVISGGRAFQSAENFKMLDALADKLNAAIGASRAAVDAGYAPNDFQVGQTGKVVAPDLYIAIGISGAIQHIAGMKDSKVIVAINKDPEAPIFKIADYGLVGDLFKIIPELMETL